MTIQGMHYDFKQKQNKMDSLQNEDFYVPEIDWKLNEAQNLFVMMVLDPSIASRVGFEVGQRNIDDIKTLVVDQTFAQGIVPTVYDDTSYIAALPSDYWFYANSIVYAKKGDCTSKIRKVNEVQHDDEHEDSPFNRSSFEWRTVNTRFNNSGLRIFTDGSFQITKVCYEYIKVPRKVNNSENWLGGSYEDLDGVTWSKNVDCELPETTHSRIVDLAIMILAGDLSLADYQLKSRKVDLTKP